MLLRHQEKILAGSSMRRITYVEAIREATAEALRADKNVILIGEGVPDPKAVFGTTKGLKEEFPEQVFDMPVSENGMTGVCIGAAIRGIKPILVHQRIDFALYSMDQLVNNAAKWFSMFGGNARNVPLVIRVITGRGWGAGNQHSQNLAHLFATIPGLKVVCPSSAHDAKILLHEAIKDPNPVLYVEHRWLHNTESEIFDSYIPSPIGEARVLREGKHITILSWSYMVHECLRAHQYLKELKIDAEVIDLRSIRPIDWITINQSVSKTRRLLVAEEAWKFNSLSGEIIAEVMDNREIQLLSRPARVTLPDCYAPSTPHLTKYFYPTARNIVSEAILSLDKFNHKYEKLIEKIDYEESLRPHDIPDSNFKGPF